MKVVDELNKQLRSKSPEEILSWAIGHFGVQKVTLASSLGAEDQVLTAMLIKIDPKAEIFTLDTGRLPQETHDCIKETEEKYGFRYKVYSPDPEAVNKMVSEKGIDLFYENLENRKLCCQVRKIEPLKRALLNKAAWICGLRREQSVTRAEINTIERDEGNGMYKINPLKSWTEKEVWYYIKANKVPYNKLHDKGYPSIGCEPCTRAVKPGEDVRSGRWWWESADKKECGLHIKNGKVIRKKS